MQAHIAQAANRSYVFQPYIFSSWSQLIWGPVRWYRGSWKSATIPLSAFIVPPHGSVNDATFDKVCPRWGGRTYLDINDVRLKYGIQERDREGPAMQDILDAWVKELSALPDKCVVIRGGEADHVITLE